MRVTRVLTSALTGGRPRVGRPELVSPTQKEPVLRTKLGSSCRSLVDGELV